MATHRFDRHYVDGGWQPSLGAELELRDPATEEPSALVRLVTRTQAAAAVQAAARALPRWTAVKPNERAALLVRAGAILERQADALALALTREIGTPIAHSRRIQIEPALRIFRQAPRWIEAREAESHVDRTMVTDVPLGAALCITPWNYPLYLVATKIAPALVAGATVVLKPSEIAPASIVPLAEAMHEAGVPPGVFNFIFGDGPEIGETLILEPDVRVVSFTGSTEVGRRVAELAGRSLKKTCLELGGKSASVALEDAPLARAVEATLQKCFQNAGQTCAALSRLLVPEARLGEACDLAHGIARKLRVGDPGNVATDIGPLISSRQFERARKLITGALADGAQLIAGGSDRPPDVARGYFIAPTVLTVRDPSIAITQTEVFAPVLTITPYQNEEQAVAIANGTAFGLAAAVWSSDEHRALDVAKHLRCGSVSINGALTHPDAPFGGFGDSGFGRERGQRALDEFLTTKAYHR